MKTVKRIPAGIFLLRKSVRGGELPVMKDSDFPTRFHFNESEYEIKRTREGKLIMVKA